MKCRSARFSFDIYVGARTGSGLGVSEGILDLELLNGIWCGDRNAGATERSNLGHVGAITIPIHAVEHEVVVASSCAIGADLLAAGPQLGRIHDIGVRSSRKAENFGVIPIDQRQVDYSFLVNDSSESGILRLQEWGPGAHRDLFLCALDRQLNLQPAYFGDLNLNTFQDEWLKAGRANR